MSKIDEFKVFAKANPTFANYIKDGSMTWQKFYELYDMYGNDNNIWDKYINTRESYNIASASAGLGLAEAFKWFKNIDLDSVQSGVTNLQKVVDIIQDFGHKNTKKEDYKPRPLYKHFDD